MSETGAEQCVQSARDRGSTIADVDKLIDRYVQDSRSKPNMHVGWLNRWISGKSTPEAKPQPVARRYDPRRELDREIFRLVRTMRSAGKSEDSIDRARQQLESAFAAKYPELEGVLRN